jgi:hypothetical protein
MSSRREMGEFLDSAAETERTAQAKPAANPRDTRGDRLSSEDLDAEIRWFFENAVEQESARP